MKVLIAIIASASWLTGCTMPDNARESDPTVKGSYRCGTAATRRAVPTPELGARQTSFTVIGHFPDPGSAGKATESLRTVLEALLEQRDGSAGPDPLTLEAYGVEVEPHLVDGLTNVDNSITRLGRTVFLRAEGKRPLDGSAFASVMGQLGADVLNEVPGDQRMMNVEVIWDTPDAALDQAITDDISQYLAMPFELMLVAPWAPGVITPEQAAARRDFRSIRAFGYTLPMKQRRAEAEALHNAARRGKGEGEGVQRVGDTQEKRNLEQRDPRMREYLDAHPDVDLYLVEGFLRWSSTFDLPVRYRLAAALGERMGQLEYTWVEERQSCLKIDPREAYSGLGSMERVAWEGQGERLAASFIAKDIAVGLPALVDYLCARGVESVTYTVTDYSAYM